MVAASSAGHSGAASATWEHVHRHFAVAALFVARTPHIPLAGQRSTRMSISTRRAHGGITSPCARQVGASLRRPQRSPQGSASFSESKRLREIPHWWILGRCGPPSASRPRRHVVRVYGPKASKMSQKACLEFVAAPQPARAAGTHRLLDLCTPWVPGSAPNRPDRLGSTPARSRGCGAATNSPPSVPPKASRRR